MKFLVISQQTPINGNFDLKPMWRPKGAAALVNNTLAPGIYAVPDAEGFAKLNPTVQLTDPKNGNPDPPGALVAHGLTKEAMATAMMGQGNEEDVA